MFHSALSPANNITEVELWFYMQKKHNEERSSAIFEAKIDTTLFFDHLKFNFIVLLTPADWENYTEGKVKIWLERC